MPISPPAGREMWSRGHGAATKCPARCRRALAGVRLERSKEETPGERDQARPERPPVRLHVGVRDGRPPRQGLRLHRRLGPRRLRRPRTRTPTSPARSCASPASWSWPARSPPGAPSTTTTIAREAIRAIGYTDPSEAFNADGVQVIQHVTRQAAEITRGRRDGQGPRAGRRRPGPDVRLRHRRDARAHAAADLPRPPPRARHGRGPQARHARRGCGRTPRRRSRCSTTTAGRSR